MKKAQLFDVLSPDGFSINMSEDFKSKEEAQTALNEFVERYRAQGYYSTVINGNRVKIELSDISSHCKIVKL